MNLFKRLNLMQGIENESIEDLILFKKIEKELIKSMKIYRGISAIIYDSSMPGNWWTKSKELTNLYVNIGYLLIATIPCLVDKNKWNIGDLIYHFLNNIVRRFNIEVYKIN